MRGISWREHIHVDAKSSTYVKLSIARGVSVPSESTHWTVCTPWRSVTKINFLLTTRKRWIRPRRRTSRPVCVPRRNEVWNWKWFVLHRFKNYASSREVTLQKDTILWQYGNVRYDSRTADGRSDKRVHFLFVCVRDIMRGRSPKVVPPSASFFARSASACRHQRYESAKRTIWTLHDQYTQNLLLLQNPKLFFAELLAPSCCSSWRLIIVHLTKKAWGQLRQQHKPPAKAYPTFCLFFFFLLGLRDTPVSVSNCFFKSFISFTNGSHTS